MNPFLYGFCDELEKLAKTRWQKEWPTMSPENRRRILTAVNQPRVEHKKYLKSVGRPPMGTTSKGLPNLVSRSLVGRKNLSEKSRQDIRRGLFAPTGSESKIPEKRSDLLRRQLFKSDPPTESHFAAEHEGPHVKAGQPGIFAPKYKYAPRTVVTRQSVTVRKGQRAPRVPAFTLSGFQAEREARKKATREQYLTGAPSPSVIRTPEMVRATNITGPTHELSEKEVMPKISAKKMRVAQANLEKLKRMPKAKELLHEAFMKRVESGVPISHGGVRPLITEHAAAYGSPGVQRTVLGNRTRGAGKEWPWIQSMKEHGWTPQRGLPSRPGLEKKIERRAGRLVTSDLEPLAEMRAKELLGSGASPTQKSRRKRSRK